jgi:hypothetical protein
MSNTRLNRHTTAFLRWKGQTQDTFEFSVLVCNAVPTLKRNIRLYEKNIITELTQPDYYGSRSVVDEVAKNRNKDQLKKISQDYKSKLSKYILISNFSFFESYVFDVIEEMIKFHGGKEEFKKKAKARGYKNSVNDDVEDIRKKIRLPNKPENNQQYRLATQKLDQLRYRFPSDMFGSYGVLMLLQKVANMKSADIPTLLNDGLHMDLSDDTVESYHNVREVRNKIAHGEQVVLTLKQVTDMSKSLRKIALKLDQHLLRYYFISEEYRI